MTKEELAEELFELISVRGRWKGRPPQGYGIWSDLDDYSKNLWLEETETLSNQYSIILEES